MYKVVVKVEDQPPQTEMIRAEHWKHALVKHSVFYRTAIMELSILWLKDYKSVKSHYNEYDIYIDVLEIK